jgi:RNase P/RNase MRP subunit p29
MKSSFLRPALALALAAGLVACGGKATFGINGTVIGQAYAGLVLTNNGTDLPIALGATTYSFPGSIEYGEPYEVTVKTNPPNQTCETDPQTRSGTAGRTATINVAVQCVINTFSVGGKITGLTTEGLVLTNGTTGGTVTVVKDATVFAFAAPVAFGQSYGVTVLTQPKGQTCAVTNGVGIMGNAKVENIQVTCNTSIGG